MQLAGALNKGGEVNAFSMPIFTDEKGAYFIAVEKDGLIHSFIALPPEEEFDLIRIADGPAAETGNQVILCFVVGGGSVIYGTRTALTPGLVELLLQENFNLAAKLTIAVFLHYHGLIPSLVEEINASYAKHGVNCQFDIEDYIRPEPAQEGTIRKIHAMLDKHKEMMRRYKQLEWVDLFYFRKGAVVFGNWEFPMAEFFQELPDNIVYMLKEAHPMSTLIGRNHYNLYYKCLHADPDYDGRPEPPNNLLLEDIPPGQADLTDAFRRITEMSKLIAQGASVKKKFKQLQP